MKKKTQKKSKSVLNLLIPDHVKRTNDNSEWCGTVNVLKKDNKKPQTIAKNGFKITCEENKLKDVHGNY